MVDRPHIMPNTDKVYPCTNCGSPQANVIREAPNESDKRLKCFRCKFTYSAKDSLDAQENGRLPDADTKVPEPEPPSEPVDTREDIQPSRDRSLSDAPKRRVPRSPAYVFIRKDRTESEFCTKRDLKKVALKWEAKGRYDLFELSPKQSSVKVSIE